MCMFTMLCRRKKKCATPKQREEIIKEELDGTDNKVAAILGTVARETIDEGTMVTTEEDVIASTETSQSESSIVQAPITLQTIPT